MKTNLLKYLLFIPLVCFVAACSNDDPEPEPIPEPEEITLEASASEHQFESNVRLTFAVTVSGNRPFTATSSQEWCTTEIVERMASNLLISVSENGKAAPRSATVTIATVATEENEQPVTFSIEISQLSAVPELSLKEGDVYITGKKQEFTVHVTVNFPVIFAFPSWVSQKESNDLNNDSIYTFIVNELPASIDTRKDSLIVRATDAEITRTVSIPIIQTNASTLNVMTWNIHVAQSDRVASMPKMAWDYRKGTVAKIIRGEDIDILGVQEDEYVQRDWMNKTMKEYESYGIDRVYGTLTGKSSANSIFYRRNRFTAQDSGTFWASRTPDVPSGWTPGLNIPVSWMILKDNFSGKRILVFNIHLDWTPIEANTAEAYVVMEKLQEMNKDGLPVIMVGDFNVSPEMDGIKHITNKDNPYYLVSSKDLTDNTLGPVGTYHDCKNADLGISEAKDFIFVTDGTTVLRHEVMPPFIDGIFPSDHSAVTAIIDFGREN
jgi:endonuclease/exonuclease/phosphatase family metal-dependent hydrolase